MDVPHFIHPFVHCWTLSFLPLFGYHEYAEEYSFFLCISGSFSKDDIVLGCEKIF